MSKLSNDEKRSILTALKQVSLLGGEFKNLYKDNLNSSDEKLLKVVDGLENMLLKREQDGKKKAKTVADTMDFESVLADYAKKEEIELMRYLIEEKGISVNDMGPFNTTPIFSAIQNGKVKSVEFLLSYEKTDINYISGGGNTPLMTACRLGDEKIVDLLLNDSRIDVNIHSPHGATALHNAAAMGHENIVKRLLQIPKIQITSNYTDKKHSPLSLALQAGHKDIYNMLKNHQKINSVKKIKPI